MNDIRRDPKATLDPRAATHREGSDIAPITVRIPTAIRMTGTGRPKLYELIQEGAIDVVKIGSSTLIPVASLQRLIERNRR